VKGHHVKNTELTFFTFSYADARAAVYEKSNFLNYTSKHIHRNTDYSLFFAMTVIYVTSEKGKCDKGLLIVLFKK
jgi:hypothetical protein